MSEKYIFATLFKVHVYILAFLCILFNLEIQHVLLNLCVFKCVVVKNCLQMNYFFAAICTVIPAKNISFKA